MKTLLASWLLLLALSGCTKDSPEAGLPLATQTGANTAGCLIDGHAFLATGFGSGLGKVAGIGGGFAFDSAYYLRLNGKFGNTEGSVHLFIIPLPNYRSQSLLGTYRLNQTTPVLPAASPTQCRSYAAFFPNDNPQEVYSTNAQHTGTITFTYVNLSNLSKPIVAGTFEFTAVSNLDPSKTIRVTSGRFDRQQ